MSDPRTWGSTKRGFDNIRFLFWELLVDLSRIIKDLRKSSTEVPRGLYKRLRGNTLSFWLFCCRFLRIELDGEFACPLRSLLWRLPLIFVDGSPPPQ